MNVVILSMMRCGVSWVGDTLKHIYKQLYGRELEISYENDRVLISNNLIEGWNTVYDVDPKVLLRLGYKVLCIKRDLEEMMEVHARYHGYLEVYESLEVMKQEREGFFERIRLTHQLLYDQSIKNPNFLMVNLRDLNDHTTNSFEKIIHFLGFKLTVKEKFKLFLRILRNKIKPLVVPCKPPQRDWEVYSAMLPEGKELCDRLEFIKKIRNKIEV